jgi:hypothetical protein
MAIALVMIGRGELVARSERGRASVVMIASLA